MKLPNGKIAIVEIEKLRDYCLSRVHPRGQHKARVFFSPLGMNSIHAQDLRSSLLDAAIWGDASFGASDLYGTR